MAKVPTPIPVTPAARKPAPVAAGSAPVANANVPTLTLKTLILDANSPSAMIAVGNERFTIQPGESLLVSTPKGSLKVRCDEITSSAVRLEVNDGHKVTLRVR